MPGLTYDGYKDDAPGRDENGPTALLNSVVKLPLHLAAGTPVLNLGINKPLLKSEEGRIKVAHLVRTLFNASGMQLQISSVDSQQMREAQKHPDKHRDLIVRIGGYSEYFNVLEEELQDSVISRTEYGL